MKYIRLWFIFCYCFFFAVQAQAKVKADAYVSPMIFGTSLANLLIMADSNKKVEASNFFSIGIGGLPPDPTLPPPPVERQ